MEVSLDTNETAEIIPFDVAILLASASGMDMVHNTSAEETILLRMRVPHVGSLWLLTFATVLYEITIYIDNSQVCGGLFYNCHRKYRKVQDL